MTNEMEYKTLNKELSELEEDMPPGEEYKTQEWVEWRERLKKLGETIAHLEKKEGNKLLWAGYKFTEIVLESYQRIEDAGRKNELKDFDKNKKMLQDHLYEIENMMLEAKEGVVLESFSDRGEWNNQVYEFLDFFIEKQADKIIDGLMDEWYKIEEEYKIPEKPEYTKIPPGTMAAVYWDVKIEGVPLCLHFRYWGAKHEHDRKNWVHPPKESEGIHMDIEKGDPEIDVYVYEGTTEKHDERKWRAYYSDLDSFINHFWRYNILNSKGEPANAENDEDIKKLVNYIKTDSEEGGLPFELPDNTGRLYMPKFSVDEKNEGMSSNWVSVYTAEALKIYMERLRRAVKLEEKLMKINKRATFYGIKESIGKLTEEDKKEDSKLSDIETQIDEEIMGLMHHKSEAPPIAEYPDPESYLLFHRLGHFTDWPSPDRVVPPWLTDEEYSNRISNPLKLILHAAGEYDLATDPIVKWQEEDGEKIQQYVKKKTGTRIKDFRKIKDHSQIEVIKEILNMKQKSWEKQGGPQMIEEEYSKRKHEIEQFNKDVKEWKENLTPEEKQAYDKEAEEILGGGEK